MDEQGETVKETVKLIRPKNFQAHLFNIEQIDNHNLPPLPSKSSKQTGTRSPAPSRF
ncbi:hypothetical protein [Ventosimonas gracilis]|uniref:hypothetical protein n=1 Tax=Ventosimonas gracilis TaxID=1680762 RepID=UPI001EFAD2B5|nr:hypothetical protein [Ventosimonas gracilis]